jgi:hypothetical protein
MKEKKENEERREKREGGTVRDRCGEREGH